MSHKVFFFAVKPTTLFTMLKAFFSSYLSLLKNIAVVVLLVAVGGVLCFAFVWPLWYLATNIPRFYTVFAVLFFIVLIVVSVAGKADKALHRCQSRSQKKKLVLHTLCVWGFRLVFLACLCCAFLSVLNEKTVTAVILIIMAIVIYGIYNALIKGKHVPE